MVAGAPAAARDAMAARIESLCKKEPVHVAKVQAALERAEEVAEKKHNAVWTAREAADKEDQHVLNLRQRVAELTERIYTDTDAHMAEDQWRFWRLARSWWFLVWLAVGSAWPCCAEPALWRNGRHKYGLENRRWHADQLSGAVLGMLQGQADLQGGHGTRGTAAAVTGLQQAAVPATPVERSASKAQNCW